ncbi:MAG TPA: glycosyltransferase [Gemmatimonadaceae bacterium]|jgi:cellulose synthase/poly-beta-1,6-N-acetylglucosamine synthase-like glycosyltransferase|nr:glycosyltransferase [Gemmatimonadaceae bacterium]
MSSIVFALAVAPIAIATYAYVVYPLVLWVIASMRPIRVVAETGLDWPSVTITIPVYNAVANIGETLERLLGIDYPKGVLQLLVISDASTDGTDDVVRTFGGRGVELLRLPKRTGKTGAENAAFGAARGEILVNVDASIVVPAGSLKSLVRAFDDPTVGVASGRDVSVGDARHSGTSAESTYTGYEMWIRDLETRVGSIVGASGCFYGIRRCIRADELPRELSWDFASPLVARKLGYRSVSVSTAPCIVPRTAEIRTEIRRKVRTMARGLSTLFYLRSLMNPFRFGGFALMLISHKLLRWLPYLLAPVSLVALGVLSIGSVAARALLAVLFVGVIGGTISLRHRASTPSKPVALAGFFVAVVSAGLLAWWEAIRRTPMATWEPTPRGAAPA